MSEKNSLTEEQKKKTTTFKEYVMQIYRYNASFAPVFTGFTAALRHTAATILGVNPNLISIITKEENAEGNIIEIGEEQFAVYFCGHSHSFLNWKIPNGKSYFAFCMDKIHDRDDLIAVWKKYGYWRFVKEGEDYDKDRGITDKEEKAEKIVTNVFERILQGRIVEAGVIGERPEAGLVFPYVVWLRRCAARILMKDITSIQLLDNRCNNPVFNGERIIPARLMDYGGVVGVSIADFMIVDGMGGPESVYLRVDGETIHNRGDLMLHMQARQLESVRVVATHEAEKKEVLKEREQLEELEKLSNRIVKSRSAVSYLDQSPKNIEAKSGDGAVCVTCVNTYNLFPYLQWRTPLGMKPCAICSRNGDSTIKIIAEFTHLPKDNRVAECKKESTPVPSLDTNDKQSFKNDSSYREEKFPSVIHEPPDIVPPEKDKEFIRMAKITNVQFVEAAEGRVAEGNEP